MWRNKEEGEEERRRWMKKEGKRGIRVGGLLFQLRQSNALLV